MISLKLFRRADIRSIVDLDTTVGAGEARVFKHLVDFGISGAGGQLTGMQVTMFFRVIAAVFGHLFPPRR